MSGLSPQSAWIKDGEKDGEEKDGEEKDQPQQDCLPEHTSNESPRFVHDWLQSAEIIVSSHDIGKMRISYNG